MNPEMRRQARMWLALVFLFGIAIGGVFGYSFARRSYAAGPTPVTALSEPQRRAKRVQEMTDIIGLNSAQAEKLDGILHTAHDEMKTIRDNTDAENDAVRQKARAEMRLMLTPEQLPKFEEFIRKLDEERKKQAAAASAGK